MHRNPEIVELIASLEQKECDDCGKKEVEWASLRKGTVICSECFCFHSYLGPSISFMRHLRRTAWDDEHIRLLHSLNGSNTNMIWESALYEGVTKFKKPGAQDPPHLKEQFIREKYEKGTFQPKRSKEDDTENSLNKQLIACARSDFAHVTLRLITLGANVNFVDSESGDTAMHVAAREGNSNQVELLFLYGADILTQNKDGLMPHMVAKEAGNVALHHRIYEFLWYIFDRFSFFLCSRKPDHKNNQDFFIPEMTDKSHLEKTKSSRIAIGSMNTQQFFDLCEDVYDETIRRENELNYNSTKWARQTKGSATLFLPPSHQMSAARNQRRQKLAKFNSVQFTILLIDLMKDQKRRVSGEQAMSTSSSLNQSKVLNPSDTQISKKKNDQTDYDEVPPPRSPKTGNNSQNGTVHGDHNCFDELLEFKERLENVEHVAKILAKQNEELTKLVHSLQAQNINANSELISLREEISKLVKSNLSRRLPSPLTITENPSEKPPSQYGTPSSFTRSFREEDRVDSGGARWRSNSNDRRNSNDQKIERKTERRVDTQIECASTISKSSRNASFGREEYNNVIQQSENVTRAIRTLLQQGKNGNLDRDASSCALEISRSISTLINMFPSCVNQEKINILVDAVVLLNAKCNSPDLMPLEIIDCAHSVADKLRLILLDV